MYRLVLRAALPVPIREMRCPHPGPTVIGRRPLPTLSPNSAIVADIVGADDGGRGSRSAGTALEQHDFGSSVECAYWELNVNAGRRHADNPRRGFTLKGEDSHSGRHATPRHATPRRATPRRS